MTTRTDLIRSYANPHNSRNNPHGNPFGIKLSDDVATIGPDESEHDYRQRIANEITYIKYPRLRRAG